jgi:4-hydroxybenzoate polyprenyltransferase
MQVDDLLLGFVFGVVLMFLSACLVVAVVDRAVDRVANIKRGYFDD